MADDSNFRSFRPVDPLPRRANATATSGGREGASDPLAELAKLIGQSDPFGDMGRGGAPANPQPAHYPHGTPGVQQHSVPHAPLASSFAAAASAVPHEPQHFSRAPAESQQPQQGGFQPAYDPAVYGSSPHVHEAHASEPYFGAGGPTHAHQSYDDDYTEPRSRRGFKLVAMLAVVAVVGAGGVFGYRALFRSSGATSPPPVIKADTAPTKVVPTATTETSNKAIYDRVGDTSQPERVVSREEKPVDVKDASRAAPRPVFPGMPGSPSERADAANASAPLTAMPPSPASAEPKKIRTVTIRPDQPLPDTAAPRMAGPPPAPARVSNQQVAAPPSLQAAAGSNAPLSLSPQAASASAPPPPTRPQAAAPRPAPAPVADTPQPTRMAAASASGGETGSYAVQVSSQRSETEAQASFRSLQTKFPNLLGDRQPIVRRADLGDKGTYYRTMVGGFASQEQATQFCGSLKAAGGQCVVQRN